MKKKRQTDVNKLELFKKILNSGREIIGFDLSETGVSKDGWDENVGARVLFKLCNLMLSQN